MEQVSCNVIFDELIDVIVDHEGKTAIHVLTRLK
jgi:hypothetical protein